MLCMHLIESTIIVAHVRSHEYVPASMYLTLSIFKAMTNNFILALLTQWIAIRRSVLLNQASHLVTSRGAFGTESVAMPTTSASNTYYTTRVSIPIAQPRPAYSTNLKSPTVHPPGRVQVARSSPWLFRIVLCLFFLRS